MPFRARLELRRRVDRLLTRLRGLRASDLRPPRLDATNAWRISLAFAGVALLLGLVELFRHMWQRFARELERARPRFEHAGDERVSRAWRDLVARTSYLRVTGISLLAALVHYRITGLLFQGFGAGHVPVRGEEDYLIERLVLWLCVVLFNWLVYFVMYVSLQVSRFALEVREAAELPPREVWPVAKLRGEAREAGLGWRAIAARAAVGIVRDLCTLVGGFVWWPALMLFLMVLSRASLFDRWGWSPALVITFATSFVLLLIVGQRVRSAARGARDEWLAALRRERVRRIADEPRRLRLEAMMEELRSLNRGVFAPFWEHPLLKAWLLPIAALGANQVVEVLLPRMLDYA